MAESVLCEKKSKKAKKKKLETKQPFLENIPEELCNTAWCDDLQQIHEIADAVLEDVWAKAATQSYLASNDELEGHDHDAQENCEIDSVKMIAKVEVDIEIENINEEMGNNDGYIPTDDIQVVVTNHSPPVDLAQMQAPPTLLAQIQQPISHTFGQYPNLAVSATCNSVEMDTEEKGQEDYASSLKPSVFVGKNKLYNSSLQLGCRWDRSKYNLVLLPDLSKVVYPDLDALLAEKSIPLYKKHKDLLAVDRSSKPKPSMDVGQFDKQVIPRYDMALLKSVDNDIPISKQSDRFKIDYKVNTSDSRFTDYASDEVDFRIFMNPVKWNPVENSQLVLFGVGNVYFEEFFINCANADELIEAIKERAKSITKRQLQLAQTCLLSEFGDCKSFRISGGTLVIYGSSSKFDWTSKWQRIRFGVNETFYEEDFSGCKCFEDIAKAVKNRAEVICTQQIMLKTKAYSGSESASSDRPVKYAVSDTIIENLQNYDFDDADFFYVNDDLDAQAQASNDFRRVTQTTTVDDSESSGKNKGFKTKFKSLKKWLKGTFSKKPEKNLNPLRSQSQNNQMDVGWHWNDNDSPDGLRSPPAYLNEESENAKE